MVEAVDICSGVDAQQIPWRAGQWARFVSCNAERTCDVFPSYFAKTEWMLTWGMMFLSTASWNKGGGGRSSARNKYGDVEVLSSILNVRTYREIFCIGITPVNVKMGFHFLSRIWSDENLLGFDSKLALECLKDDTWLKSVSVINVERELRALESFFFEPRKSLWRRLSNQPKNSTGSPCCSRRNFPALARFTSWRNSCGLTWLLNRRGFQIFLASPANRFRSSGSFPRKLESSRWSRKGGMCSSEWIITFIWSFLLILLSPTYPGRYGLWLRS